MGEADRYIEYKNSRRPQRFLLGQDNNALVAVWIINIACFLILLTLQVGYYFYEQTATQFNDQVMQWFALPYSFVKLSERPWTLLTYMFSESSRDLFRGISNMLWLGAFGYVLQQIGGNSKLIAVYLYGGWIGGLIFMGTTVAWGAPPIQISLLGANASVMAVAVATTALDPSQRFFTHIRKGIPIAVQFPVSEQRPLRFVDGIGKCGITVGADHGPLSEAGYGPVPGSVEAIGN
jgi:membrane associated rhomboid family serine protease